MQMYCSAGLRVQRSASVVVRSESGARILLYAVLLAAFLAWVPRAVQAQYNASLRGTVTDPSGAVIPGATVMLKNLNTGITHTVTTNAAGIYTIEALPPAPFRLTASHAGFKTKVLAHVKLIPEEPNTVNVQLTVGTAHQTVTVSAVTRGLPTDTATLSQTISSRQIQHMPSFNRDVFSLAELTPGVIGDASQGAGGGSFELPGNQGPGGGSASGGIFQTENGPQVQDMGGQYENNSISIDGISTVSAVWGGTSVITPTEDSVQSMHVVSNSYTAQTGRFSGAHIEITTRSGTNQVHGSLFFKASRPGLNAYQRWNGVGSNHPGVGATPAARAASRGLNRDTARFNQYGGSLGGPFWKDHIFGFFALETAPTNSLSTAQGWYETPQFDHLTAVAPIAKRYLTYPGEGVISSSIIPRTCGSIGLTAGVNCNNESGGLDIGSPLKSAAGTQDLTYGGNAGTPGVGGGLDGVPDIAYYNTLDPTNTSQTQYNGRLDANITPKDRLTFTIYWVPISTTDYNGPARTANYWHHTQVNDAFSLIWNHTFSPTMLNQARANAAGYRWNEVASNPQEPFGLPQDIVGEYNDNSCSGSACAFGTANFNYFGAPGPTDLDQWTYTYNDVLTKIIGNQSIKVGGELTRLYYLNNAIYAARPTFYFHNLWDFANDAPYRETGTFNHSTGVPFSNREDNRENLWGFFVQDDDKILPNLTLNMGLRWSYFGGMYSTENNLDVMQFGTGANPLTGLNIRVGGHLYTPSKINFGPQFGFAWQPKELRGKGVLRGGFGINYNQNEIAVLASGFGNPPNAVNVAYECSYPYTTNPTCGGTGILYETASNVHSVFGYAPNPSAITKFSSANLPLTGSTTVDGFDSNPGTITDYHYSLEGDYQLPYDTVAMLSYQGSQTRNMLLQENWNAIAAQRGLALNPAAQVVDIFTNAGQANYNALVSSLTHNFSHQFQAEAEYTWGKSMDDTSGPYYEDPYPYDRSAAYGPSDYNINDEFKIFGMWEPSFFAKHSLANKLLGGWTVSGIWNWHTGFPWDPSYKTEGIYYQNSGYGPVRPAAALGGYRMNTANSNFQGFSGGINPDFGGNGTKYFTAPTYALGPAFPKTAPGPVPGIHRNSLIGPHYNDLDASLSKAFGLPRMKVLGNAASIVVRADAYNLFNKTNINPESIDTTLGSVAPNGRITSVNPDFGIAGGALAARQIQLQARFSF